MHIAIITEYNPFHKGHEYQISELRRAFPDAFVTSIMGGIFSQRGEPYISTPYVRAEAAVMCGADLCIELPFPFSCAPAKIFARAGVEIASKIGADMLAFGSECGDLQMLEKMLCRLDSEEMKEALQKLDAGSTGKTRAYASAYKNLYGEELSDLPNDILAIEYLRAIKQSGCILIPYTIKRIGSYKGGKGGFESACELRSRYAKRGTKAMCGGIPKAAHKIFESADKNGLLAPDVEKLAGAVMLELSKEKSDVAYSGGGLLGNIKNAATTAASIKELKEKAATKRYTDAEISRCLLYALLNVTDSALSSPVYCTKLLSANKRGCKLLNRVTDIEIITKPSALDKLSANAKAQYESTFLAERAFALCLDGRYDFTRQSPRILP